MTPQAEPHCATCPVMVAVVPLRYAIGPVEYHGDLLNGLELPGLPDTFPTLSNRYQKLQGRALCYVPRLLRNGWLYVWVEAEERLVEYGVNNGLLKETPRGGTVVDTRELSYLQVPAGDPIAVCWSPVRWQDHHFQTLATSANDRALHLRELRPGNGAQSAVFTENLYNSLPEFAAPSDFDWSGPLPTVPFWPRLDRQMRRLDQQAAVVVDDPWGVIQDLAGLIRLTQQQQEAKRARFGEEWGLAGVIRELRNNDAQLQAKLPELTDYPTLQRAWQESDESQRDYETAMTALVDTWAAWLNTLHCEGVGSLHSACESFDLTKADSRAMLEDHFSISLMGPSSLSRGAVAIGRTLTLSGQHTPWLWYVLLGLKEKLTLGDIEKIVTLGDHLAVASDDMGASVAAFVAAINNGVLRLNLQSPAPPTDAFYTAISPVVSAELKNMPGDVGHLGSGFMMAALSRTGSELAVESVSRFAANQWLSEAMGTAKPGSAIPPVELAGQKVPVFRMKAANAANFARTNPYTVEDAMFKEAKLRSILVVLTGVNLAHSVAEFVDNRNPGNFAAMGGSIFGLGTAYTSVHHKLAELNWQHDLSRHANPEASSHAWGMGASSLAAITAAFDVIIFGLSAFESYQEGDFDTAGLEVGLAGISVGQFTLAVTAFRAYREARAFALGLETATAVRGLSRLGGWFTALSIGLTASLIGGLVTRHYIENTPLEGWVATTRFGTMPADWAGDFEKEMQKLYKAVFPIKLRLENAPRLNPRTGEHVQICMLLLELPGQSTLSDEMIHFKGRERLNGPVHQTLAWTEETIRSLFSDEDREQLLNRHKRSVEWRGEDFDRHQGTRVKTPMGTVVYRRIYHGKDRIEGVEGTLTYQPQPGLTMPPLEVSL